MLSFQDVAIPMRDFALQKCMLDDVLWRIIGGPTAFERDRNALHDVEGRIAGECFVFDIALRLRDRRHQTSSGDLAPYRAFSTTVVASKTNKLVWAGAKDSESDEPMAFQQISDDGDPIVWGQPMQRFLEDHLRNMTRSEPDQILVDLQIEEQFMSPAAVLTTPSADGTIVLDRLLTMEEATATEKAIFDAWNERVAGIA